MYQLSEVEFLPPVPRPEKIICVGINYPERTARIQRQAASSRNIRTCSCAFPIRSSATSSRWCGPKVSEKFDYEGEIVLVIGREGRNVPRDTGALAWSSD